MKCQPAHAPPLPTQCVRAAVLAVRPVTSINDKYGMLAAKKKQDTVDFCLGQVFIYSAPQLTSPRLFSKFPMKIHFCTTPP